MARFNTDAKEDIYYSLTDIYKEYYEEDYLRFIQDVFEVLKGCIDDIKGGRFGVW